MCLEDAECDHGYCDYESRCECDLGYVGTKCDQVFQDYVGVPYLVFFYTVCVINVIMLGISCWKCYLFFQERKNLGIRHISVSLLTLGILSMLMLYRNS